MDGGVAFARAANTALISICGELQWSYENYELFCSCDLFVRRRVATLITSTLLAQLQGEGRLSPRPALPGTCTHVHMYTCTLYAHGPHGVTHIDAVSPHFATAFFWLRVSVWTLV